MIIVGGTYEERCSEPRAAELAGSGLRAASALSYLTDVSFVTCCEETQEGSLREVAAVFGFELRANHRSGPVGFDYWTPLSAPSIMGREVEAADFSVDDDSVLCFGMIEAAPRISADWLVLDPQRPRDLTPLRRDELDTKHLALVANSQETRLLSGVDDLAEAANVLLRNLAADVVITKRGGRGALVTTSTFQHEVGALPTETVWPLGSGDIFAAAFAWAWMVERLDPVRAAEAGSRAAAFWCSRRSLGLERDYLLEGPQLAVAKAGAVYLAGPFFSLSERWLTELVYQSLRTLGDGVFSPFHDVGVGEEEVAKKDLAGLDASTAVLALFDVVDSGTAFEAGWARRSDCPVIVYTEKADREALKMLKGTECEIHSDLSTAVYRSIWHSLQMLP